MTRLLLASLALLALSVPALAQEGDRQPPNPDTDHDGKVTLSEFKAMETTRINRMFARMDTNRDGKITPAEMQAMRERMEAEGRGPPPGGPGRGPGGGSGGGRGGFMTRMDTNGDGAVTKAEMAAGIEARFKAADTNGDGWLSKGELLMMRQRMRGPGPAQ